MRFRHFLGFGVVALLAGFAASTAFAQFQPPPQAYPADDLGDIEARAPAGTSYPYDPRAGRETAYEPGPYDPRYGREVGRAPGALPPSDPNAPYGAQRPYGHYGDRAPGTQPGAQPGDTQPRPPVAVAPQPQQQQRSLFPPFPNIFAPQQAQPQQPQGRPNTVAALPEEDQPEENPKELPAQFKRATVPYATKEPVGTIIVDTNSTYLYLVQPGGQAIRYGIGVGREGFTWAGVEKVSRMTEWPDWHPPAEMIERQPYLPRFMAGGESNPLGARALYLGKTIYRIHGTNQPSTIGKFVSSGCIRMLNEDAEDLYSRVKVGTRVVVLPGGAPASASSQAPITR